MKDLPYYRMWVKDFDTDENVRLLNLAEAGLYLFALNHAWVNDGLPEAPEEIGRALRLTVRQVKTLWPRVSRCFYSDGLGRLRNRRQEEEREKATMKSKQASEAVAERERKRVTSIIGRSSDDHLRAQARADSDSVSDFESVSEKENDAQNFELSASFEDFWRVWWNKTAKADAQKAWPAAAHSHGAAFLIEQTISDRARFEPTEDWSWRAKLHPATWLRGRRWEDQTPIAVPKKNGHIPQYTPEVVPAETPQQRREALEWIRDNDADPQARANAAKQLEATA